MHFRNREEAGEKLAQALAHYRDADAVVYALPRGGVVLGAEIARALHLPLEVVITRKIGHPMNPEYAICALSEEGDLVCNETERANVDPRWLEAAVERERREAARRHVAYLGGRAPLPATGKVAILVDDGIATGLTMRAAIRAMRRQQPRKIVVAIPVIPPETAALLRQEVDEVVALDIPPVFLGAIGMYYDDFRQVSDAEVIQVLREDPVLLFTLPPYGELAAKITETMGWRSGTVLPGRFPNGEWHVTLRTSVREVNCLLLASIAPPDEHLLSTLLCCHTLDSDGARSVTAVLPYLAYARQEKAEAGQSRATWWLASMMAASGIDAALTVDIHSEATRTAFPFPMTSLSPASLFAEAVTRTGAQAATPVAPDEGAIPRCQAVAREAGMETPLAYLQKARTPEGVQSRLLGTVGRQAVVVDDMLDTGGTLVACCRALREAGTETITILVTHGLFTGDAWEQLWTLGVTDIYCTDSVPLPARLLGEARIHVLSVAPLLAAALRRREEEGGYEQRAA